MGGVLAAVVAALVGGVLALVAGFGLVSSQTAVPAVVDAPYITYGQS